MLDQDTATEENSHQQLRSLDLNIVFSIQNFEGDEYSNESYDDDVGGKSLNNVKIIGTLRCDRLVLNLFLLLDR